MENIVKYQDTDRLAAEINIIKQQTARNLLVASIEIGEKLTQAKNIIPHGEWEQWLKENVDYSQSTAQNLMKLYREYGGNQLGFASGKTPMEIFGNLTYTQALALLALPSDEREEFVEENKVDEMSTRELQQAIADAQAAKKEAEEERRRAADAEAHLKVSRDASDSLKARNDELAAAVNKAKQEKESLEKSSANKIAKAEAEAEKLRRQLEELTKPRELTEEERAAVEKEIAQRYEAQINQLALDAETAKANEEKIQREKEALESKYQKESNAELQHFQALFERFQLDLANLIALADKIGGEKGERLKELIKQLAEGV